MFDRFPEADCARLETRLKERGMLTEMAYLSHFVTHCDASREHIDKFVDTVSGYFAQRAT